MEACFEKILSGTLENGIKYLLVKVGRMDYGLKLEDIHGNTWLSSFSSSKKELSKKLHSYLKDCC